MANIALQTLLHKEASREEFVGLLGLATVSILGFGHITNSWPGNHYPAINR
jgi:hypothetical protein